MSAGLTQFFEQVFALLTTSPGNLTYHAILGFTIIGALQSAASHWRRSGFPQGSRMVLGLLLLLVMQLIQFIFAALAWQGLIDPHLYLPPIDRAVMLLGLVIIVWLWVFPEPVFLADAVTFVLGVLVGIFSVLSLLWWVNQGQGNFFNETFADWASNLLAASLAVAGGFALVFRMPNRWSIGLLMLGFIFIGQLVAMILLQPGSDYQGAVRLAQLVAIPCLLALPQRFPFTMESTQAASTPTVYERRRYSVEPGVVQSLLALAAETSHDQFYQETVRVVSQIMLAEFCLLVLPPDPDGNLIVAAVYNNIEERTLEGFNLEGRFAPTLANAIRRGRVLRLPASSTSPDLAILAEKLHLTRTGHLLAVPVSRLNEVPFMGIVLISPFSNRGWSNEDQVYLVTLARYIANALRWQQLSSEKSGGSEGQVYLQEKQELLAQLEAAKKLLTQEKTRAESLAALVANQDDMHAVIDRPELREEVFVPASPQVTAEEYENLRAELRLALEQVAELRSSLEEAESRSAQAFQPQERMPVVETRFEEVASAAQDLKQPMSSIVGYTDLLLGESVGILGALQRKFLERIRASVERMAGLTDDLIHQAAMKGESLRLSPEIVDLNAIIDDAVASTMDRLREKNIILRMDIPEQLPLLKADREALHQILINLLHNAGTCTPVEGEVYLRARVEAENHEPGYVLIQVSDSGGGIPPEDLPRVFSRLYRSDNTVIQGVGDTGVGLSTVKALVEAHGGRVWVDTVLGKGSTFSALLPYSSVAEDLGVM